VLALVEGLGTAQGGTTHKCEWRVLRYVEWGIWTAQLQVGNCLRGGRGIVHVLDCCFFGDGGVGRRGGGLKPSFGSSAAEFHAGAGRGFRRGRGWHNPQV
jgi:hypothetical protein